MFAARNIKLCTKDCVCLMVCPTGATDTENGQIDSTMCIDGCRLCVDACPSHAIYLMPRKTAEREAPAAEVTRSLTAVLEEMAAIHYLARKSTTESRVFSRFLKALGHSTRVLAEDCFREMGFISLYPSRIKELTGSPALLSAFEASYGSADELRTLAEEATHAVATGLDVEGQLPRICVSCGRISLESDAAVCPSCGKPQDR